jgi:hypothetical protein
MEFLPIYGVAGFCLLNHRNILNLYDRTKDLHSLSTDVFLTSEQIARRKATIREIAENLETPVIPILREPLQALEQDCTKEELMILKYNLQTLKLKRHLFSLRGIEGLYNGCNNQMTIIKDNLITKIHESYHAATCMTSVGGNGVMGFLQENFVTKKNIGCGLNEGYTESLCKCDQPAYSKTVALIPLIEAFYDDPSTLRGNYFDCDLPAVISYFSQIEGREKALELISIIDRLTIHQASPSWGNKACQYELMARSNLCSKYEKWSGKSHQEEQFFTKAMLDEPEVQKLILAK